MTNTTVAGLRRVKAMYRAALMTNNCTGVPREWLAEHARKLGAYLRAQRALKLPRVKPVPEASKKRNGASAPFSRKDSRR